MAALNILSMFMVLCSMLLGKTARNSAWMGVNFRASSSEGAVTGFDRLEDSSGIYNRGKMHKDKQSNTEEEQNNSEPGRQRLSGSLGWEEGNLLSGGPHGHRQGAAQEGEGREASSFFPGNGHKCKGS